jgi:hypothetical protein
VAMLAVATMAVIVLRMGASSKMPPPQGGVANLLTLLWAKSSINT